MTLGLARQGCRRARLAQPWFSDSWLAGHATTTTTRHLMGRNNNWNPLTKAERKRVKTGRAFSVGGIFVRGVKPEIPIKRQTTLESRRPSQTSNNWVHAVLFVVLIVIVVSWTLGY